MVDVCVALKTRAYCGVLLDLDQCGILDVLVTL